MIRGIGTWLCCLVIAFPLAQLYGQPPLLWLLPLVGFNTVIAGFNSSAIFTLNRHLGAKQLASYELLGQVVSVVTMLTWAWFNPSIWALVAGGTVSSIFYLSYSHWLNIKLDLGIPNRITWDRKSVQELVSFGKWIFVSTMMTFLSNQADRLILGALFTLDLLGVYGVAFTLADIPRSIILAVSGKVIYPVYSRLIHLPRIEFRDKVLRNRAPILIALTFGLAFLVSFGDIAVRFLYSDALCDRHSH